MATEKEQLSARVATSAPVIVSLALLLVNDWYLKAAYGNWFTGKLSDFAGILLFALLAFAFLPHRKAAVALGICAAFVWWKSPLAQPLIDAVHFLGVSSFNRVVDHTDLIALVMVPLAWCLVTRRACGPWSPSTVRRAVFLPLFSLSVCSMVATTFATHNNRFDVRKEETSEHLDRQKVASAIRAVADKFGLVCVDCSDPSTKAKYNDDGTWLEYFILNDGTVRLSTGVKFSKMILPDGTKKRTRELQRALRKSLEDHVGKVEIQNHAQPPSTGDLSTSPLFPVFASVFKEVAGKYNLVPSEWSDEQFKSAEGTLSFGYRYESLDTVRIDVLGDSDDEVSAMTSSLKEALEARFTGLEYYSDQYIYFGGATLIDGSEDVEQPSAP